MHRADALVDQRAAAGGSQIGIGEPVDEEPGAAGQARDEIRSLTGLALRNITASWGSPAREWKEAMNQFAIAYDDRFKRAAHGAA